jgi:3-vinyl bacteriochlorophyllide hydratase
MSDRPSPPPALYTREQRWRRDHTPWTLVQGVLAPFQFVVFVISVVLVGRTLIWGTDAQWALWSVVFKTVVLYLIMITGSIWEKKVFGQYLFAASFFWEDVVSMGVMLLHTAYVVGWYSGWLEATELLWLALAAYASYVVNAAQFVWKLRLARLGSEPTHQEDLRPSASRYGRVT